MSAVRIGCPDRLGSARSLRHHGGAHGRPPRPGGLSV